MKNSKLKMVIIIIIVIINIFLIILTINSVIKTVNNIIKTGGAKNQQEVSVIEDNSEITNSDDIETINVDFNYVMKVLEKIPLKYYSFIVIVILFTVVITVLIIKHFKKSKQEISQKN